MRVKTQYLVLFMLILPHFQVYIVLDSTDNYPNYPCASSPAYGISNYQILQSVTYQVEINFSLTHLSGGVGSYIFKFARLDNRGPNSTFTKYTPPYQESMLKYNKLEGCEQKDINLGHYDKFNNSYDSFNATLLPLSPMLNPKIPKVTLNQKYIVKLNAINFHDIDPSEIGQYDQTDEIFELYCNKSEQYYERDNLNLITLSNEIVDFNDNPVEKAEKIFKWVSDNLDYNGNLPSQEMGALWAYNNLEGDCSEFSSLMITLLRIQDIPARKVTGFLVSNDPSITIKEGDSWIFHDSKSTSTIIGHAWVEYYIPNIGWIACDPTWDSGYNYFNRIDILRFNLNVGANFFFPPSSIISEYLNPLFSYSLGASYKYEYIISITVIESNISNVGSESLIVFLTITGVVILGFIILIIVVKKKFRKKEIINVKLNPKY